MRTEKPWLLIIISPLKNLRIIPLYHARSQFQQQRIPDGGKRTGFVNTRDRACPHGRMDRRLLGLRILG